MEEITRSVLQAHAFRSPLNILEAYCRDVTTCRHHGFLFRRSQITISKTISFTAIGETHVSRSPINALLKPLQHQNSTIPRGLRKAPQLALPLFGPI